EPPAPEPPAPEPPPRRGGVVDRIAAVVNDDVITLSEVYEIGDVFVRDRCAALEAACVTAAELEILETLIRRVLIRQELDELQLDVSQAEVDQAIDRTVQQYQLPDRAALRTEVEASGKRWEDYREELTEYLRTQAFQARVLSPRISIREDELLDLYQRTARDVTRPVVKVSGIGIAMAAGATPEQQAAALAQAEGLVADLNAGKVAWEEAVRLYDAGASGMFVGQEFDQGSMIEPLAGVVFTAPIGVVQPPVRVSAPTGLDVLFLMRVDEKSSRSEVAPFEDVRGRLEEQVFQGKLVEAEEEWYQRARREAALKIKLGS
ncbi:MAG: SurA N-terminal domain-containing protein, partial [Myxococcota bacterium]